MQKSRDETLDFLRWWSNESVSVRVLAGNSWHSQTGLRGCFNTGLFPKL